jgi:hypothetical protein
VSFHFVQVVAVGFDPRMAKIALQHHQGDVEKAVDELVMCGGIIDGEHCTDGKFHFPFDLIFNLSFESSFIYLIPFGK